MVCNNGLTQLRKVSLATSTSTIGVLLLTFHASAQSLIVPDDTLGAESSVVLENFNGLSIEVLTGGATRGQNLFHSFQEFNIDAGRRAYFLDPVGVENILTRVTGSNPSDILGVLGVAGTANLFLINPNGILFGENAILDVQGSFTGTTANVIQFGKEGGFNATDPELPSALLTVDPSAYVFNQIGAGSIINRSVVPNNNAIGLRAGDGQMLTLLSPEIRFEGGQAYGFGGDIHIGGITEPGVIERTANGELRFLEGISRANINLTGATIFSSDTSDIDFYANSLVLSNSLVLAQADSNINIQSENLVANNSSAIATFAIDDRDSGNVQVQSDFAALSEQSTISSINLESATGRVGDVLIETNILEFRDGSSIRTSALGNTNSGNISIQASERVQLFNRSDITATASMNSSEGNRGGDIAINTRFLNVQDSSIIQNTTSTAADAGLIQIRAEEINLNQGFLSSTTLSIGNAGIIDIGASRLNIFNGSSIGTFTAGIEALGDAGNIIIRAAESIDLLGQPGALINTGSISGSRGNGGTIFLETNRLSVQDGASISASTLFGGGSSGKISILANEVTVSGWQFVEGIGSVNSQISVFALEANSLTTRGNIAIDTQRLILEDGGTINASAIFGLSNAGNIEIDASEYVSINGQTGPSSNEGFLLSSRITSQVEADTQGDGGRISINTPLLNLQSGALISTSTSGQGDAGQINLAASQIILQDGVSVEANTFGQGNAGDLSISASDIQLIGADNDSISGFFTLVSRDATGNAGNQTIQTDRLLIQNGASIQSTVFGNGDAGNLLIEADEIRLTGSGENGIASVISADVGFGANGNGGDIAIRANELVLADGAGITATTFGNGDTGNLTIQARNIQLSGIDDNGQARGLLLGVANSAIGNSGNLQIDAENFVIRDGAGIITSTSGVGNAGDISIQTSNLMLSGANAREGIPSGIFARTRPGAFGTGGDINIDTNNLRILDGAIITAQTFNQFTSGNITVNANRVEAINGGQITTSTRGAGNAGNIILNVADTVRFLGQDATYNIRLQQALDTEIVSQDDFANESSASGLFANTRIGSTGDGGQIIVNASMLILEDRAQISSQSLGSGIAGDIRLNSRDRISLTNSDIVTTAAQSSGGNIEVNIGESSEQALLILNGDSDITTESFGDGGNITLGGLAIIAFDDSDIIARSQSARGGNITLSNFFSETIPPDNQEPFDGDDKVDVNADGQITAGVISFPDISFIENSLTDLPKIPVDTDSLIAGSCIARSQDNSGSFIITGPGGLPARPGTASTSAYPIGTVRTTPTETADANPAPTWPDSQPIVEPQGIYQLADGRLVMSRECSSDNP